MLADAGVPDILADRHADHRAAKDHRLRQGAGLEQAHFVESAVIGQLVLEADGGNLALIQQGHAIVQGAIGHEHTAHQHGRASAGGGRGQVLQLGGGALHQGGFQHQILGRIADEVQLGKGDEIRAILPRARPRAKHGSGIAGEVPHRLVHLGERDLERIGHGEGLGRD